MGSFTATSSTLHTTEVLRGLYENTKWVHTALPAQSLEAPKSKIDLKDVFYIPNLTCFRQGARFHSQLSGYGKDLGLKTSM